MISCTPQISISWTYVTQVKTWSRITWKSVAFRYQVSIAILRVWTAIFTLIFSYGKLSVEYLRISGHSFWLKWRLGCNLCSHHFEASDLQPSHCDYTISLAIWYQLHWNLVISLGISLFVSIKIGCWVSKLTHLSLVLSNFTFLYRIHFSLFC